MLIQQQMIARIRQLCQEDPRIVGALMYGSFTRGEGDAFSDIEFCIYLDEDTYQEFEPTAWVAQVAPVAVYFSNEFGVGTAIFENLVRGEFHFDRATDMTHIRSWKEESGYPAVEAMLLVDRTGELTEHLRAISGPGPERGTTEQVTVLWQRYLNWMIFGASVLARGERARALEILWWVQRYLLWFVRLREGSTVHWQTPSKNVKKDLSPGAYRRYIACTAGLRGAELERAYGAAWVWGKEMIRALAAERGLDPQEALVQRLDAQFARFLNQGEQEMRVSEHVQCEGFPCAGVDHDAYRVPDIELDPERVSIVLISEAAPPDASDYYYAPGDPLFQQTTVQAFQDAGADVSSIQDILDLGVYMTTAVKCGKTGYTIKAAPIKACSLLLERELALFPNVRAYLLMGDVAIKAINYIALRAGETRVIPAGSTYKIRSAAYTYRGARAYPSYTQAGPSFFIEKSKRRMIAEDIGAALRHVQDG
jgi:lincosamide nucleotidyltransferase